MINLIHWEIIRDARWRSAQQLVLNNFTDQVRFIRDSDSTNLKQLKENTFNDSLPGNHNIFLAHLSNLGNVKTFLSIVTTLQNEYPEMIILLYTGGTVAVDEKSKAILLDQTGYLFTPTYPDRVFFKGVGIYSNKDFCEALNLKSALERFLTTNDIKLFFQAIDRRLPLSDNTSGNIFLNNQDVVSKLKSIQGKKLLFIWDGNFAQEDDSPSKSFVTNLKDLNETVGATGQNLDFDAIIIIAELAWGRGQNEYEGLELAVKFRKENRYVGPLILISYSTIDDFERMYQHHKDAKFNIVFAPCTYLINISIDESPTSLKEEIADVLERATLLSAATLQDINTMLLNEEGDLIDRFTHALFIHKSDEELEWLFEYAKKITPEKSQHLNDLQKSIIIAKANKDEKGFESLRASLIQLLEGKFVNLPANHLAQRVNIEKNKPKILIIEDSIDYQQVLIQHLGSRFDLSIFSSGADAIEYLKQQDIMTEIGCIVSDWRLYRGESKYVWQEMQGYETIQQIALFHPASLVCLTSEIDKNVNIVRNFLGSNISFFKKQYLQSSTKYNEVWDVFADTIEDLCMNSMNLVSSQPTGSSWSSENAKNKNISFKTKYLNRRRTDWHNFEHSVTTTADKCWNYYRAALSRTNPFLRSIEAQFGLTLGDNLENTLIVRRLWLALWFNRDKIDFIGRIMPEETPEINIYIILKDIDIDEEKNASESTYDQTAAGNNSRFVPEWKRKLQNNANALCNVLCIVKTDLPGVMAFYQKKKSGSENTILISKRTLMIYYDDGPDDF